MPTITSINWINATSIQVIWTQLTLEESREFITSYSVASSTAERNTCSEMETNTIFTTGSENSQLIINNLDPNLEYCVGIAASTISGTSDFSNKHKVPCNVSTAPPPGSTNGTDIVTYQIGTTEFLVIFLVAVGSALLLIIIITAAILYVRRMKKGPTKPM